MEKRIPLPKDHRRMSKAELSQKLSALQSFDKAKSSGDARETELQLVLHELEVYQIELEMQVRELQDSRAALEESHDRYVNLYDFAPVGYMTLSDQGVMKEINLTAAGMLGVERQWLIERTLSPWIVPNELPQFRTHLKICKEEGGKVKTNLHLLNRNKKAIPVELLSSSFTDSTTGLVLYRTAITDLSDRRRAEADLNKFFSLSADILSITGMDGQYIRINPACETVLGYTANELLGRTYLDFIHPDDREAARAELVRLNYEGAVSANYRTKYLRKDRSTVWLSWTTMTSEGRIYCVGRDVTESVREMRESEESKELLKETVEKLKQERELRELFVLTLTHDLRTPLTAAKMAAQLLNRKNLNPALLPKVSDQVVEGIDRVDLMIQDLLDANRIRAGEKLPLKRSRFDLCHLVASTLNELSAIYGNRFVLKGRKSADGNWGKHGMKRVIENLVSNAVKYGDPERPITICIESDQANRLILSVHNFGDPIPLEEQPTLFQQFRRASFAQEGIQKGWGLGLTIVLGIVESHGGEIKVESNLTEGTTFRVILNQGLRD